MYVSGDILEYIFGVQQKIIWRAVIIIYIIKVRRDQVDQHISWKFSHFNVTNFDRMFYNNLSHLKRKHSRKGDYNLRVRLKNLRPKLSLKNYFIVITETKCKL